MRIVGIDPATHTGFVALGPDGNLAGWTEFVGKGDTAPTRINFILNELYRYLKPDDYVCIEGFAMEAKFDTNKVSTGFNWAARLATDRKVGSFISATPNQLKKFVDVSEWEGESGSKVRLDGKEVKRRVMVAVQAHWGDKPKTENIADAYVLARIAEAVYKVKHGHPLDAYPSYQQEVITAIIDPKAAKKSKKTTKSKTNKRPGKPAAKDSHTQNEEQTCLF
jgi:crossover junction endodeoxyribonuclease RuvC